MKFPWFFKKEIIDKKFETEADLKNKDSGRWRDLTAYWILGLCNNYGYVVMLSAAHDIIGRINSKDHFPEITTQTHIETERTCHIMSTGTILLADIIPSLVITTLIPFFPLFINLRVFVACFAQCAGFLLVAYAKTEWMAISGVSLTSVCQGLGETSLISYSAKFHKNVVSTWSSGTGGAGILGSISYAALIALGVSPVNTMLIMLLVPLLEGGTFWLLLRNPSTIKNCDLELSATETPNNLENVHENLEAKFTLGDKIRYIPSLYNYLIPLLLVFVFEYFINQGLMELIQFEIIWLDQEAQYRWLQVDYQVGVFFSRSSVNLVTVNNLWLLAILQFLNVVIILIEVITFFSPSIWIVFAIVLWEGLLGGSIYVNMYYRMSKEIPEHKRDFALSIGPVANAIGIALAGVFAIPAHNALCKMPMPVRH